MTNQLRFDAALTTTSEQIDRVLLRAPIIIRNYTKHLTASKGKQIRAMAVLACAMDQEGRIHPDAVTFAAAIELLHLATLVHDDVIDNADLRRGRETLQKKFGKKTAVICGDYLFSAALRLAQDVPDKNKYLNLDMPDYIGKICLGELTQHLNNGNLDLSTRGYLRIIAGKTAALFEASYHAGAILASDSDREHRLYRRLGYNIGMIFQLTDDCMDFEATIEEAQKPVQSDFEQNVITLPLIHTLHHRIPFKEKTESGNVTRVEINQAVKESGGLDFTRMIAKRYYDRSKAILSQLELTTEKRELLTQLLDKSYRVG